MPPENSVKNGISGVFPRLITHSVLSRHRVAMCELAVKESDWIMIDQIQIHSRKVNPLDDVSTVYHQIRNSVKFLRNFYMVWISGVDSMAACSALPMDYSWHIVTLTV